MTRAAYVTGGLLIGWTAFVAGTAAAFILADKLTDLRYKTTPHPTRQLFLERDYFDDPSDVGDAT